MIEKINKKVAEEVDKILEKEDLTGEEIQVLLAVRTDLKFEEKMKKMIEFTS